MQMGATYLMADSCSTHFVGAVDDCVRHDLVQICASVSGHEVKGAKRLRTEDIIYLIT